MLVACSLLRYVVVMVVHFFACCGGLVINPAWADTVYKYQDQAGNWHFTDTPPSAPARTNPQKSAPAVETMTLAEASNQVPIPRVLLLEEAGRRWLYAINPWAGPVDFGISINRRALPGSPLLITGPKRQLIEDFGAGRMQDLTLEYQYLPGDPEAVPDDVAYLPPLPVGGLFKVTQGFRGRFSHQQEPNVYAIDIAMPVGTPIRATRAGTVMAVKDDYHMGSPREFFADKANYVMVLHADGSIALYGHIMLGGALVKLGQQVAAGDAIARSGTTGFSTGPHLHFAIHANQGHRLKSVPFRFRDQTGALYIPTAEQWVIGY